MSKAKSCLNKIKVKKKKTVVTKAALLMNLLGIVLLSLFSFSPWFLFQSKSR